MEWYGTFTGKRLNKADGFDEDCKVAKDTIQAR